MELNSAEWMPEEEVFRGIAARVAALDYSDQVFVRPGHLDADADAGAWRGATAAEYDAALVEHS
ncbi:hypothetical protein ABZV78_11015 [Micromonospora sp. NPDC004540]|uniref:hypothetical protein n=1 Tax=Micromonospora sp. NPDC004540 TaxID=3154457 RepID=UPI0033BFAEA3